MRWQAEFHDPPRPPHVHDQLLLLLPMTLALAHGHPLMLMHDHHGNQPGLHLHLPLFAALVIVVSQPLVRMSPLRAPLEAAEAEVKAPPTTTRVVTLRTPGPICDRIGSLPGTLQVGLHLDLHFLAEE